MKKTLKTIVAFFFLFAFLISCQDEIIQDSSLQETETIQKKAKYSKFDLEKINFLKKGLKKKIRTYNNKHRKKNKFFKKYGKLKGKNAVTVKFPSEDNDFLVAVPFKRTKHKNKLLVAYYKNGVRKYTIIKKNKKYKKKKLASVEMAFLKNSELLFELTKNKNRQNTQKKSTTTKSGGTCTPHIISAEIISDCAALITYYDPCEDFTFEVVSSDKACEDDEDYAWEEELDEVIVVADNYPDSSDNPWENPDIPNDPLPDYNEPDELCDEMMFECEDGLGNEESVWDEETLLFEDVDDPVIEDIDEYNKCFDKTKMAKFTLYVDQPINNSSSPYSLTGDVGHTFISIAQDGVIRSLGFYPSTPVNPITGNISTGSDLRNNEGHEFDVSISTYMNSTELTSVINLISNYNSNYNLDTYNCTDFALSIANSLGLGIKDTNGSWPGGSGSNPGNLGQEIRKMKENLKVSINKSQGSAPSNSGSCN